MTWRLVLDRLEVDVPEWLVSAEDAEQLAGPGIAGVTLADCIADDPTSVLEALLGVGANAEPGSFGRALAARVRLVPSCSHCSGYFEFPGTARGRCCGCGETS